MNIEQAELAQKEISCRADIGDTDLLADMPKEACAFYLQRLADVKRKIKEVEDSVSGELIRKMKEEKVKEFAFMNMTVKATSEKKTTVNLTMMNHLLFAGVDNEKEMARNCLSQGQGAWKPANVEMMQDTLGRSDLIKTTWLDKVKVAIVDPKYLGYK